MGSGATQFGKITVRTTVDLGLAISAGALDSVDLGLLQGVWEKEAPHDVELLSLLELADHNPTARSALAKLLQHPARKNYWAMARGHLGHLRRFAPAPVVTHQVSLVLERSRNRGGTLAYVGASNSVQNQPVRRKPILRLDEARSAPTAIPPLPKGLSIRENVEFPGEEGKRGFVIEWGGEATVEEVVTFMWAFRPAWFKNRRGEENVRFVLPPDVAQRLLDWGGRLREVLIPKLEGIWAIVRKKLLSQPIMPADEQYLRETREFATRELESFSSVFEFLNDIRWFVFGSEYFDDKPMSSAIHNLTNVGLFLQELRRDVLGEIGDFERDLVRFYPAGESDGLDKLFLFPLLWAGRDLGFRTGGKLGIRIELDPEDRRRLQLIELANNTQLKTDIFNLVVNLITNAIRYADPAKEGLTVKITASKLANGSLMITVADNGIGIKPHNVFKLGTEGFREGRKEVEGSQGIGLSSVVETLAKVGVPLWVRSQKGKGAEFRFILPAQILTHLTGSGWKPAGTFDEAQADLAGAIEANARENFQVPAASMQGNTLDHFARLAEGGSLLAAWNLLWMVKEEGAPLEAKKVFARLHFDKIFEGKTLGDIVSKLVLFQMAPGVGVIRLLEKRMSAGENVELARVMMRDYRVEFFRKALEENVLTPELGIDVLVTLIEKGGNFDALTLLEDLHETGNYIIPFDRIDPSGLIRRVEVEQNPKKKGRAAMGIVMLAASMNRRASTWVREQGGVFRIAEMLPSPYREIFLAGVAGFPLNFQ